MALQKLSFAVMIVPSSWNSITACVRWIASISPLALMFAASSSSSATFRAVMSVAYLTTLYGLPFSSKIGL